MPIKNSQALRGKPDLTKQTHSAQFDSLIGTVTHMCGWRKTMEDADIFQFNIDGKGTHLFAVFDGHGGGEVAIFAKRHFKRLLLKNQNYNKGNYQKALNQVFPSLDSLMMTEKGSDQVFQIKEQLDTKIKKQYHFEWQQDSDEQIQCLAGSTAIVCLMTKQTIYIASLGDSRCLISSNRQVKELSIQHKPDLPKQKARIEAAGGKIKNHRINGLLGMSRSLGDFQFKNKKNKKASEQMVISQPHIETLKNQNIQFILLGCDGIWQGYSNEWYSNQIHQKFQKSSPSQIVQNILDTVVAKDLQGDDGHDNMTAILILVNKVQS